MHIPLCIEFVIGSRIRREPPISTGLPIVENGPPGTFVLFPWGPQVPLPTDQIVGADDTEGAATVEFGGMRFDGLEEGLLVFRRVKELWPEAQLSPERSRRMTLDPGMVAAITLDGKVVWPPRERLN
jgi:hypothetical protein